MKEGSVVASTVAPAVEFETVVGLEIHAQLITNSKMFCGCSAAAIAGKPNANVCPICMGMPGVLPVVNRAAVRQAVRVALALHSEVQPESRFDRKNYTYPDLPKGYQISQYDLPLSRGGFVVVMTDATKKTLAAAENSTPEWGDSLKQVGVSQRSIAQIARQLESGEYDLGYVDFVLTRIQRQHSLGKVKKLAGAIYKTLIEKYLLGEYLEGQQQPSPRQLPEAKKHLLLTGERAKPEKNKDSEIAFRMSEVRDIYDNPGPFLSDKRQGLTFEQHVEQVYLADGFVVELRNGEEWLVK